MNIEESLKNYSSEDNEIEQQIRSSRSLMLITLLLFTIHSIQDTMNGNALGWNVSDWYIYLKVSILLFFMVLWIFSFFRENIRKIFGTFNFVFTLILFFLVCVFSLIEGNDIQSMIVLLTISLLFYSRAYSRMRVILFTIFSNISLFVIGFDFPPESFVKQFVFIHLVTTLGMALASFPTLKKKQADLVVQQLFEKIFSALRDPVLLISPVSNKVVYTNKAVVKKSVLNYWAQISLV